VDGRAEFEAAVSVATGDLRAGAPVEREAATGLRRAIAVLRGEAAGLARRIPAAEAEAAAARAERDAARSNAAAARADAAAVRTDAAATAAAADGARDAAVRERDEARTALAAKAAELETLQQQVAKDAPAVALGWEEMRRRYGADVADAIERKVATPLTTAAASAYLRGRGFPAGSQPAGITWGIDTVPADRLTASSVHAFPSHALHPGCRLLYTRDAVVGKSFFRTKHPYSAGEWVCVDLGGERSVVGALVQSYENTEASAEGSYRWHRHKFQWSADGATWTDVDGGRVWSRDGLVEKDVSACVFGAPVRCRYLRIVAVSRSGYLQWEVVVMP
jgi:hypothetical protein